MSDEELTRGDRIDTVADLFRILRRAREYLVEADRQLRGGGTPDEQSASQAWYADMDANDEWTGFTAEAHVACVHDAILFFDEHPDIVASHDNKPFLIDGAWRKITITETLTELREQAATMELRIGQEHEKH